MAPETQQPVPARAAAPLSHDDAQREFALTLSGFSAIDKPEYDDYSRCVHCGLCANNCPTYRLWGQEADSPRGRIRQMALVDQGRLELGEAFVTHIDRCLNCRHCETVCPSGVEYGKILVSWRGRKSSRNISGHLFRGYCAIWFTGGCFPTPAGSRPRRAGLEFINARDSRALARGTGILRLLGLAGPRKAAAGD